MNREFLLRWAIWASLCLAACFNGVAQQCWVLPGLGNPFHYGLHRVAVSQSFGENPGGIVWLQDGRVAVSFPLNLSPVTSKRGVIRVTSPVSKSIIYDNPSIRPPDSAGFFSDFGFTLATSGNYLAATFRMTNNTLAVAINEATNSTAWALRAVLQPDVPTSEPFGSDMAMSGRWIALVAFGTNGGIYLFRRDDAGEWLRHSLLKVPGFPTDLALNTSMLDMRMRGDLLAVGQSSDGNPNSSFTGRVHLWRLQPNDAWTFETTLSVADAVAQDGLGTGLALADDMVFAGASGRDDGATDAGALYIFRRANGTWSMETKLACPTPEEGTGFGLMVDHSDIGPHLSVGSGRGIFQFVLEGANWVYAGRNGGGNVFYNWLTDANTRQTYLYGTTNERPRVLFQRGQQIISSFASATTPAATLLEIGWHRILTQPITNNGIYNCYSKPLNYAAIGASSEVPTDGDNDRISDLEEGYFGTLIDPTNTQEGKMKARPGIAGGFIVQWPRAQWTNFPIQVEPQWSSNLVDWSTNGITTQVIGQEPNSNRDIIEATIPGAGGVAAYFRLKFSLPRGPASEAWP